MAISSRHPSPEPTGPAPSRPRLLARVRRSAWGVMAALLLLAGVASWLVGAAVGGGDVAALGLAQAGVVAAAAGLAYGVARRSTRVVEDLFRREDKLVLAVAHEIRSPLARLLVALDEGLAGEVPAEVALKEASRDGDAMGELVDDLIEAARVMSGAVPPPREEVDLEALVAGVARTHARGRVRVDVLGAPLAVAGSPRLLRLAVSNLVRNAVRHGYGGRSGVVTVVVDDRGVLVADRGPGIAPDHLAELRRDIPRGLRRARAGLGLALAGWVCDVHGGRLELANAPEGGLHARLALPVADLGGVAG